MNLNRPDNLNKHTTNLSFQNAHGKILYGMTNDYMFHAVLQSNDKVLRGLICSLLKPVIHIGVLNYTLFEKYPEFYATYKLKNVKTDHIYSDSLTLSVLDLSKASLATENDKKYRLDQWAALFKSQTWEDLKMISANDEYLTEAAETIYQLNADKYVLKRCQDRDEYYNDIRYYQNTIAEKDNTISRLLAEKDSAISQLLTEKDNIISKLLAEIELLKSGK